MRTKEINKREELPFADERREFKGMGVLERVNAITTQTGMIDYNEQDDERQRKFWKIGF